MKQPVYISDLLEKQFSSFAKNLRDILDKNGYVLKVIENTNDIWRRDYMPVKGSDGRLVRFTYNPKYLAEEQHTITDVDQVLSKTWQRGDQEVRK